MGRSKFPGKPAKHVNKKRVNVLPCSVTKSNDTSTGHNVFSETSGTTDACCDTEQVTTLSGSNDKEAVPTVQNVNSNAEDVNDETNSKCSSSSTNKNVNKMTLKENQSSEYESLAIFMRTNKSGAFLYNYTNYTLKNERIAKSKSRPMKKMKRLIKKPSDLSIVSKVTDKNDPVASKVSSCNLTRKSLYTRKRQPKGARNKSPSGKGAASSRLHEKESTSLVGKFVLPSRSLHSSRVIIPNKRFINNEQVHNASNSECSPKTSSRRTRVFDKSAVTLQHSKQKKSDCSKPVLDSVKPNDDVVQPSVVEQCPVADNACVDNLACESESSRDSNDMVVIDSSSNSSTPWSCGKLVLRKARLQLHTQSSEGMDGPFSSYSTASTNPPGTVTCGVCGAVRFYRFVKQARKFNIYSCESCRKFISKMIKRQTCSKTCAMPTLVCHKGQGMCHVPPIVRSQQWKLIRCAYKARCPACWLKMCLRSFQMPSQLKSSLTNMLPENMRSYTECNSSLSTELGPQKKLDWQPEISDANVNSITSKTVKVSDTFVSPFKLDILSHKTDSLLNNNKEKRSAKSRLRLQRKNAMVSSQTSLNTAPESTKRQKLDLKGPRVKHVCRSASIVLGQPLATFPQEPTSDVPEKKRTIFETTTEVDSCLTCNSLADDHCLDTYERKESSTTKSSSRDLSPASDALAAKNLCLAVPQKTSNVQVEPTSSSLETLNTISADFLDTDESEILTNGLELIGSEPFSVQAVCFYCGSAGKEKLIYCACCCEPYHFYCVNDSFTSNYLHDAISKKSDVGLNLSWKLIWTCSRCSVCQQCGSAGQQKTSCQLCRCYFHPDCINPLLDSDKPRICSSCLCCEDCGSKTITKLRCNLPLCMPCFNLRKKTKPCPVCQKCDEDSDSKMIRCSECKCLVHADCEKLPDEMYQILNHEPGSFSFTCVACSSSKRSTWKKSVSKTLRNRFHSVLRSFSSNRRVKELLKWNLFKSRTCSCKIEALSKKFASVDNDLTQNSQSVRSGVETSTLVRKCNVGKMLKDVSCRIVKDDFKHSNNTQEHSEDNNIDISLKNMRKKFCIKECSVRIKNCADTRTITSGVPKFQNGGCETKKGSEDENILQSYEADSTRNVPNFCSKHDFIPLFALLNVKTKISSNLYKTVEEFYSDVELALKKSSCEEYSKVFRSIMHDIFPWYDIGLQKKDACITNSHKTNQVKDIASSHNETSVVKYKEKVAEPFLNKYSFEDGSRSFDSRTCVLCKGTGDGSGTLEERLLYCGQNEWAHANCAFWSTDVYEDLDCTLQNVHRAIARSRMVQCSTCKQKGASISCAAKGCEETYHFPCARLVNCNFHFDKTMFCSSHFDSVLSNSDVLEENDFEIQRPIYIGIDKNKTTISDLSKVHYLIGSLNVTSLGNIFPPLSDTEDAIIPSEFVCSRLFWSTEEPWRIICYTITTSILRPKLRKISSSEKNFTIDHSLPRCEVEKKTREICDWKKELDIGRSEKLCSIAVTENDKESVNVTDDDKVVTQVLEHILELICSKEVEENCDDEPQNTADLLPPELKDAIFEDLPHDLLDGISMQDIFPKLMSYEDVLSMDLKNSDANDANEFLKDPKTDLANDTVTDIDNYEYKGRKTDLFVTESDFWLEPKYSIQGLDEFVQNGKIASSTNGQELKRSKSEVFPGIKKLTRTRNHQRSCSLTWSCKLDNTLAANMKKRKVSCTSKSVADISSNLFMVVDGTGDKGGMLQELRLPDGVLMTVGRSTNVDCMADTVELKYRLEENSVLAPDRFKAPSQEIEQGKENKHRVWHNRSQSRILQVDGADDMSSSASESESSPFDNNTNSKKSSVKTSDEPVKCDRCQCTYRTHTSYKRHLATCDFITSSESDSDASVDTEKFDDTVSSCIQIVSKEEVECNNVSTVVEAPRAATNNVVASDIHINKQYLSVETAIVSTSCQMMNGKSDLSPLEHMNGIVNNVSSDAQHHQQIEVCTNNNHTEKTIPVENRNVHMPSKQLTTTNNSLLKPITTNTQTNINNIIPTVSAPMPMQKAPIAKVPPVNKSQTTAKPKNVKTRVVPINKNRARSTKPAPAKRIRVEKPTNTINHSINSLPHNAVRLQDGQNGSTGPTVIFQHMASPNLIPAYVEAFQQQTGQNLQCIATIVPSDYKPQQFIASNSFVPGAYQLQSTESTNLISLPNGGLSVLSGLQQAPQPHQTVLGTLIQQPRPSTTIQCGMMSSEQLVLGSLPMDTIVTDSSGSMYFSSQPVYYGFETIVQNTVMSSQQFVSTTALPGVLASNSSYSATTTQVFQASKLEPMLDMNGGGYILMNPSVPQVATPLSVNPHPTLAPLQNRPTSIITPQQTILEPHPTYPVQITPVCEPAIPAIETLVFPEPAKPIEPVVSCIKPQASAPPTPKISNTEPLSAPCKKPIPATITSSSMATTSITLPVAPYATENGIPMNIVNPIPQVSTSGIAQTSRPMNRVLPMQTAPLQRDSQKARSPINKVLSLEPPGILNKLSETVDKIQETLNNDVETTQSTKLNANDKLLKLESASLKLVFQKQSQDGIYKISNKYISKNSMPIQITPIKQTKAKTIGTIINMKNNSSTEKKGIATQDKDVSQNPSENAADTSPNILYRIHSPDGFEYSSTSVDDLWKKLFEVVQSARAAHKMPPLPGNAFKGINGLQLLGLNSNGLRRLIEQLPDAGKCVKYKPISRKKAKSSDDDETVDEAESCKAARCDPFSYNKQPYDMFSWLASKHRNPEYVQQSDENSSRRASSVNLPMAMRFRQLKETSKQAVGVYRSSIHGRGLFCLRDIEYGEMVIEYAGEVIRSTLTDKREKYYNSKGIGCYMFRVDDNLVIDATMKGNAARFINHSCDPNCYSRVLDILGHKHILIFALRKIIQGEELTYDYKFPFEEDKIPCTCGSKRCRKYLN